MLGLQLRDEFLGDQTPGTMISLRDGHGGGAAERGPDYILSITYPTADVQTALRNVSASRAKRPVILMGDRGRGKSHILAVVHHAIASPEAVEAWAHQWGNRLGGALTELSLLRGFHPISEAVHNHEYKFLWDLLFDRHPQGKVYRKLFEKSGQPYPARSLLVEMLEEQPTALILDEFQKWFDGLSDQPGAEGVKYRTWAENFIQNLSELSKDRPEILILVVSVLNNATEAFRQIHRDTPVVIDFRGPTARTDRQHLLLHRLFENRDNIPEAAIRGAVGPYADERFRLLLSHLSEAERPQRLQEVVDSFPFAPELLDLLDNQVLMAESAQETREFIRILASVFRERGNDVPLLTPADFLVDQDTGGVQSLLDSIATVGEQEKLREIAQRNLDAVLSAVPASVPHARELTGALWMRSMTPGRNPGGTRPELHLDITRGQAIDDNAYQAEIVALVENSMNIHGEERQDGRLHFGLDENPRSKVRVTAHNSKLWQKPAAEVAAVQTTYPGKDVEHLRKTTRALLCADTQETKSLVVVLGPSWRTDPWSEVDESAQPAKWDRPVLLVIPEAPQLGSAGALPEIGQWLKTHVPKRRNTVRFLFPAAGTPSLFTDSELLFAARCAYLTAVAWKDDGRYRALKEEFEKRLRDPLRKRFDRFAVLRRWDFQNPARCSFELEKAPQQGHEVPNAIEAKIERDMLDPAEFVRLVVQRAKDHYLVGDVLGELAEPPSAKDAECLPYLGDIPTYERMLAIAAEGRIALNVDGVWVSRQADHESDQQAERYIRSKAFKTGQAMRKTQLGLPEQVGGSVVGGSKPTPQPAPSGTPAPGGGVTGGSGVVPPATVTSTPAPGGSAAPQPQPPAYPAGLGPATQVTDNITSRHSEAATTSVNLMACLDKWGLASGKTLQSVRLQFEGMTVQQVKAVLQRLPSSAKASIEVTYEEGG